MRGYARGEDRQSLVHNLVLFARKNKYPYAQAAHWSDLKAIAELSCLNFGTSGFSLAKFQSLYRVNPNILWIVKDKNGVIQGCFDIQPIKAAFAQELKSGSKRESDLTPSDLFSEKELKEGLGGCIYLAGLIVRSASERVRGPDRTFCRLVLAGMERVQNIAAATPGLSDVLALAYQTNGGEPGPATPYLIRFGFREVGKSKEGYSAHVLSSDMSYGGLEDVFSAIAAARQRHERKSRAKRRMAGGIAISALLLLAVTILMKKNDLAREFMKEIVISVMAAVIFLILEPLLKLRSLVKGD